ncbi:MAG TPA: hypothetical protein VMW46_03250 [Candidatus Desulfaltia sp.]|nr:hypothetical protein [Candidatus Desulfaltia sp.]
MNELFEIMLSEIEERKEGDSVLLHFPFLVTDTVNQNGRVYPKRVVEKAIAEVQSKIKSGRSIYGGPGHPRHGALELDGVSHLLSKVEMVGDKAYATAQVMPTQKGRNLMVILKYGGSLGVSARGAGSVTKEKRDGKEVEVVGEDYALAAVDFVTSPSFELFAGQQNMVETLQEELRQGLRGDVFPSQALLDEEQILDKKFHLAQSAGYKGDWEEFCLYEQHKDLIDLFDLATKSGYQGSFSDFTKLKRR